MPRPTSQPTPIYIKDPGAQVAPSPNPNPTCRDCLYSLESLPKGRCPECGTPFDPNNPDTLHISILHATTRRAARMRPGWFVINACALTTLPFFILLNAPTPNVSKEAAAWLDFLLYVPLVMWLIPFITHLHARLLTAIAHARQPRWSWRWLIPPLTCAICFFLRETSLIWHARWLLARPTFEATASNPLSNPTSIGTFNIRAIKRFPDGTVRFQLGPPDSLYSKWMPTLDHTTSSSLLGARYQGQTALEGNWFFDLD